ncbi:MAG: serine/threonine protein kinase, partial [Clostridiaceae bacterium]|nr:serine/threonine protein kinase [Clostridiaceae bacterium]
MKKLISQNDPILKYQPLWGSWTVEELIGKGSFGRVYRISKDVFGSKYSSAVKLLTVPTHEQYREARLTANSSDEELTGYFEDIVKNIVTEISLLYQLRGHSNIVSYEDHTVERRKEGLGWDILIKMEYVTSLVDLMSGRRLTREEVVRIGTDICSALETCEKMNIIHRDIKDENIFVSQKGAFKLGDFGIAREFARSGKMASMKGTPLYMAPEVFKGERYDSRVDIYSLGMVLYRLLNMGRLPFTPDSDQRLRREDNEQAIERRLAGEPLPMPKKAGDELGKIILKACAYRAADRYTTAAEMRVALNNSIAQMGALELNEEVTEKSSRKLQKDGRKGFEAAIGEGNNIEDTVLLDTVLLENVNLPDKSYDNGEVKRKTDAKKEFFSLGTNEIAILGVSQGVGVTHTAIMLANFLCSRYKTAILELNHSGAFKEICTIVEVVKNSDSKFFKYRGVDYYWNIDYQEFISRYKEDYEFLVLDCGSYQDMYEINEFLRADVRIAIGHAIDWKINEIRSFHQATRKYDPNNS